MPGIILRSCMRPRQSHQGQLVSLQAAPQREWGSNQSGLVAIDRPHGWVGGKPEGLHPCNPTRRCHGPTGLPWHQCRCAWVGGWGCPPQGLAAPHSAKEPHQWGQEARGCCWGPTLALPSGILSAPVCPHFINFL